MNKSQRINAVWAALSNKLWAAFHLRDRVKYARLYPWFVRADDLRCRIDHGRRSALVRA